VIRQQAPKTSLLGLLTCFVVGSIACGTKPVWAEGSKDLVKDGGNRPITELRTVTATGGLTRQTIPLVYAKANEIINLGSSAVGVGSGNILLLDSAGTIILDCKATQLGKGILDTATKETNGPLPFANGYDACKYQVPTGASGIYTVQFIGPAGVGDTQATNVGTIAGPDVSTNQGSGLSMWDVTVRSSLTSTTDIKGRVFTDKLALFMIGNSRYLKSELFVLTSGGYRYRADLSPTNASQGLDPNGFIFIASDRGLLKSDGSTLYRTGSAGGDNTVTPPLLGGNSIQGPQHKIFLNTPAAEAITALGYPLAAIPPTPVTNFNFTGQSNNQTPIGVGGNFTFDATTAEGYQIVIDTDNDGFYSGAAGDRIIDGTSIIGTNTVLWDGKDNSGADVQPLPGNAAYPARIIAKGGEYHFPLLDAEFNPDGFTLEMLNPPAAFPVGQNKYTVFYDERDYTGVSLGCPPNPNAPAAPPAGYFPCDGRGGIDSSTTPRKFPVVTSGYGDKKVVDTWTYFPSAPVQASVIVQPLNPNLSGTKSVKLIADADGSGGPSIGDNVEYTITYKNTGGGAAGSFTLKDDLPTSLQYLSATMTSTVPTTPAGLTAPPLNPAYAGTGNLINTSTLPTNSTIVIKVVAKIKPSATGVVSNQAIATYQPTSGPVVTVVTDAATPTGSMTQLVDDGIDSGNDSTKTGDDDPTLFSLTFPTPRVRLVKRITKVAAQVFGNYIDTIEPDDNATGWITPTQTATLFPGPGTSTGFSSLLQGATDSQNLPVGTIAPKPADQIEYTIYFLSDGGVDAKNVKLCDFIPLNNTYVPGSLQLSQSGGAATAVTGAVGDFYSNGNALLTTTTGPCKNGIDNGKGGVIVNIGSLPRATSSGTPTSSYGYIRFRATVE
jgi:uncharacterized repeat protein (TIGR01451 family)